ncbi:MAG: TldD/PmbA family protein [Candidatus Nanohaloarchaeota archaeon QJJ-9]|nr:TldD/PmbA family protein [Candidatus Nanohaloarchaeota archaeon QJJ-9]
MIDKLKKAMEIEGYDQIEVYAEKEESINCSVSGDGISSVKNQEGLGIGVRAIKDNRVGFAYTNSLEDVKYTAKKALKQTNVSQSNLIALPMGNSFPSISNCDDSLIRSLEADDLVDEVRGVVSSGKDAVFSTGDISATSGQVFLVNSMGIEQSFSSTYFSGFMKANKGELSNYWVETSRSKFDVSDVSEKALELLEASQEKTSIDSGEYDIVLTPYAQYQIFSQLLYPAIDAEKVQRGKSALEGKVDEKFFSGSLDIVDKGLMDGGINTKPFDREGSPQKNTRIVEEGVLKSFLYDTKRAERESRESTGNASGGYNSTPEVSPTNLYMDGEEASEPDLEGVLVIHNISGAHTANPVSGDFSLNITTGFIHGKGGREAIDGGMLVGNIFELLKSHRFFYGERRMINSLVSRNAFFEDIKVVSQ